MFQGKIYRNLQYNTIKNYENMRNAVDKLFIEIKNIRKFKDIEMNKQSLYQKIGNLQNEISALNFEVDRLQNGNQQQEEH